MVETSTGQEAYTEKLQHHLRSVLQKKATGKGSTEYVGLLQELIALKTSAFVGGNESSQHDLCNLLDILTGCISALHEQRHANLISEVYSIPFWDAIQELRYSSLCFMLHLAVINSTTVVPILQVLVFNLGMPMNEAVQQEDIKGSAWHPSARVEAVHSDIVAAIEKLLELVPVSGSLLLPILARGFPNKFVSRAMQCIYLRAVLLVAQLPRALPIRKQILAAMIQHLVSLDVEIQWQDIAFTPDEEEDSKPGDSAGSDQDVDIFELEGQATELQLDPSKVEGVYSENGAYEFELAPDRIVGRSGFEGKASDNPASTSGRGQIDETADKLDSMMTQAFQHITWAHKNGQLAMTWQALLDSFFATVLNTHRSKFTQYLLWYILELDREKNSRTFLGRLMLVLADSRQPAITRSAAVSYVASFLARAAFLPEAILVEYITRLASWCLEYCTREEFASDLPDTQKQGRAELTQGVLHQVFYAACQGLLYVLCYRLDQLVSSQSHSAATIRSLFKQTIPFLLQSRLVPMAVCLPTVVAEFAKLTAGLGLMECRTLLPATAQAARCQRPLEMFFPFDPYLLRRSAAFLDLRRTFLRWRQGHCEHPIGDLSRDSDLSSDEDLDASGSSSSCLSSGSNEEAAILESETGDLAEDSQEQIPDSSPAAVWRSLSQPIRQREITPSTAASLSTNATSSPPGLMSWTAKLPHNLVPQCHRIS